VQQVFVSYLLITTIVTTFCAAGFQVNTRTSSNQTDIALAADANGNFAAVWSSYRQDSNSGGIFARQYAPSGKLLGDEFQVNTTTVGNQTNPSVAMDAAGNFVVSWRGPGPDQEDIFAQRFDRNGHPIGSEFCVNTDPNGRDFRPKVAMSKIGIFVIVWENHRFLPSPDFCQVLYKIYDSTGAPIATGRADLLSQARYPDVAMDDDGNFTIVWVQDDVFHSSNAIMLRQYNPDGTEKSDLYQVNTTDFNSLTQPSIAMDHSGYFIVAWDGHPEALSEDDIYARRYRFDATALGDQFLVNTITAGAQRRPKAAMNNQRDFVIVWDGETVPGSNIRDIFARRYDSFSAPLADQFRVNTYIVDDQKYPAVVLKQDGQFIIAWQSQEQDGSGFGVFAEAGPKAGCADFNGDGFVNFFDYRFLAVQWLENGNLLTTDLIYDNKIDHFDFAAFCGQWLSPCFQCGEVDINNDGNVDFKDYCFLADNWYEQGQFVGDVTGNGIVDAADLQALLFHWADNCQPSPPSCRQADINGNGKIDFKDFAILGGNWLRGGISLAGDINSDDIVDMTDLQALLLHWAQSCE
jgi:hypothetical protein